MSENEQEAARRLAELFERCGTDYELSLDLKDESVGRSVIEFVRETAPAIIPRLWLCHPRYEDLIPLRPIDADVKLVDYDEDAWVEKRAETAKKIQDIIQRTR